MRRFGFDPSTASVYMSWQWQWEQKEERIYRHFHFYSFLLLQRAREQNLFCAKTLDTPKQHTNSH